MHIPYVPTPKEPRRRRWTTDTGFRWLHTLPVEINARRFQWHMDRLRKRDRRTADGQRFALKLRRLARGRA